MVSFAQRVKKARVSRDWTQVELAERLGVSRMTVIYWEHGKRTPPISRLDHIADVLGVSRNALLRGFAS